MHVCIDQESEETDLAESAWKSWWWAYRRRWRRLQESGLQPLSCPQPPAVYPPVRDAEVNGAANITVKVSRRAFSRCLSRSCPSHTPQVLLWRLSTAAACKRTVMSHITCQHTHIHSTIPFCKHYINMTYKCHLENHNYLTFYIYLLLEYVKC